MNLATNNARILTVDDNSEILDDYEKILTVKDSGRNRLDNLAASVFGNGGEDLAEEDEGATVFKLTRARNGIEAVDCVIHSLESGTPYSVAFVDVRMPPGIDGVETVERIWAIDPRVQIVLSTAYSDYSWKDISVKFGETDKLLILKKPFDPQEVIQLAHALSSKWNHLEMLHHKNRTLDKLYAEQRKYAEELARAIDSRNTFFAKISHDLRTPLNGILGIMELLKISTSSSLSGEDNEYLNVVEQSGGTLLRLVNDVVDYAQIDSGRMSVSPMKADLRKTVDAALDLVALDARRKNIQLDCAIDPICPKLLYFDPSRLEQMLYNLIGNAMRNTSGGTIMITVDAESRDDSVWNITIRVIDDGRRIPEAELKKLFKPFRFNEPSRLSEDGGTGLGLSICYSLVEVMDGKARVRSNQGPGTTVEIELPLTECSESVAVPENGDQDLDFIELDVEKIKDPILIVDDSEQNRFVIRRQLSSLGLGTLEAADGAEALEIVGNMDLEMVLMDCQMPSMDGFEATRRIREMEKATHAHTPIVAVTANALHDDKEKCLAAGFDDYLTKPCSLNRLKCSIVRFAKV